MKSNQAIPDMVGYLILSDHLGAWLAGIGSSTDQKHELSGHSATYYLFKAPSCKFLVLEIPNLRNFLSAIPTFTYIVRTSKCGLSGYGFGSDKIGLISSSHIPISEGITESKTLLTC